MLKTILCLSTCLCLSSAASYAAEVEKVIIEDSASIIEENALVHHNGEEDSHSALIARCPRCPRGPAA